MYSICNEMGTPLLLFSGTTKLTVSVQLSRNVLRSQVLKMKFMVFINCM